MTVQDTRACGHKPTPWSMAYGHWECQLPRGHRGSHRFNNYTWKRGAKTWGWLRFSARRLRLRLDPRTTWQVAIRHTTTKYAPKGGGGVTVQDTRSRILSAFWLVLLRGRMRAW